MFIAGRDGMGQTTDNFCNLKILQMIMASIFAIHPWMSCASIIIKTELQLGKCVQDVWISGDS